MNTQAELVVPVVEEPGYRWTNKRKVYVKRAERVRRRKAQRLARRANR